MIFYYLLTVKKLLDIYLKFIMLPRKQWRRLKRKFKRQNLAKERDKLKSVTNDFAISENETDTEERVKNDKYKEEQHQLWLEREKEAQALWLARKAIKEQEELRLKEAEDRIRAEWEEREKAARIEAEKNEREEKERKDKQENLLKEATANEKKTSWHNPIAPAGLVQDVETCMFFSKTGACRFGDRCQRNHIKPDSSCTLLFPGMFVHFGLEQGLDEEYDSDLTLEYEDRETYQHFKDFYNDVLPEFRLIGEVVQFKVCCNYEPHLRGNVYVQFESEKEAGLAFCKFNARWYGGRQLSCEFSAVNKWKAAICGTFHRNKCPKGKTCNFLHVFRDPYGEFYRADSDLPRPDASRRRHSQRQDYSHRSSHSYRDSTRSRYSSSRQHYRSRSPVERRRSASPGSRRLGSLNSDPGRSSSHRRQEDYQKLRGKSRDKPNAHNDTEPCSGQIADIPKVVESDKSSMHRHSRKKSKKSKRKKRANSPRSERSRSNSPRSRRSRSNSPQSGRTYSKSPSFKSSTASNTLNDCLSPKDIPSYSPSLNSAINVQLNSVHKQNGVEHDLASVNNTTIR